MKAKDFHQYIFSNITKVLTDEKEYQSITSIIFKHFVDDEFALLLNKEICNIDDNFLQEIFHRLQNNEPIQYILSSTQFLDLNLFVNPNVLIPRPETEEMVLDICKNFNGKGKNVLDIGTGSGCIALALKKMFPHANVDAIDKSCRSLEVAKKNSQSNSLEVNFTEQDILETENLEKMYDLIVSNPPYVCKSEICSMNDRVLKYEPSLALFVEDYDPLIFYKKIICLAEKFLNTNGLLVFEINERFGKEIASLLFNFTNVTVNKDINGKDRWISAKFLR